MLVGHRSCHSRRVNTLGSEEVVEHGIILGKLPGGGNVQLSGTVRVGVGGTVQLSGTVEVGGAVQVSTVGVGLCSWTWLDVWR